MKAIYYFENVTGCNPLVKSICEKNAINLDYETKMYSLFSKIVTMQPNFVIVDADYSDENEQFFDCLGDQSPFCTPIVFVLTEKKEFAAKLKDNLNCVVLCYDDFFKKFSDILNSVEKVSFVKQKVDGFQLTRFNDILGFLFKINFSVKNQGTIYLKDGIRFCLGCSDKTNLSMGQVFEYVAIQNQTTVSAVERAIRLAIRAAWEDMDVNAVANRLNIDPVFFEKQPSCRELIIFSTEFLLDQARERSFVNVFPVLKTANANV